MNTQQIIESWEDGIEPYNSQYFDKEYQQVIHPDQTRLIEHKQQTAWAAIVRVLGLICA